jgi:uncharacterized protein
MKNEDRDEKTPLETWMKWVEALRHAPDWPADELPIEMKQTHISVLLLGRTRVVKLKKPVDFGFLDYTTLEKRERACWDEICLNRRLCPDTYIGLGGVIEMDGQINFSGRHGRIVDHCVWMKRLPEDRMLDRLVAEGRVTEAMMDRIASRVAEFHRTAMRGSEVAKWGSPEDVRRNWEENFAQTESYINRTITSEAFQVIRSWVREWMEKKDLFEQRVREGRIVDGHGDLRCESICVKDDQIFIYDCIEFNDRLRCGDVASEVAFLAMDMDARGRPDLGYLFTEQYQQRRGDAGLFTLLPFYRCYRACVRGKVLSFRLDEAEFNEEEKKLATADAANYFELARRYASPLRAPAVIAVCGLSGMGKTSVARAIAGELGLRVVSSDDVRRSLFGDAKKPAAYGEGAYTAEASRQTYQTLIEEGRELLAQSGGVVLDATFQRASDRAMAIEMANAAGASLRWIACTLSPELVRSRLAKRTEGEPDADLETYLRQREAFAPLAGDALTLDTRGNLAETARIATDWLRAQ